MPEFNHLIELKENSVFTDIMKKLVLGEELEYKEREFILSCSLLLLGYLNSNKVNKERIAKIDEIIKNNSIQKIRASGTTKTKLQKEKTILNKLVTKTTTEDKALLELAYYIVVRYATLYNDYKPLYDFSVNLGYYPISRFIYKNIWGNDSENISLSNVFSDIHISQYENNSDPDNIKVLTYNQKNSTDLLLEKTNLYKAYIAPTSYGKSEFISQIIKNSKVKNIAIISPTKILVRQNGNSIKNFLKNNLELKYHIIYHHEMYKNDSTPTIASFTQERGLRFLKEFPEQYFDYIIIDEAHELFSNKGRSHLLEIFKQKNNNRHIVHKQTNQQVLFLSPVVEDPQKFKNPTIDEEPQLFAQRIKYSLKELDIFYFKENQGYKYNRFLDELYEHSNYTNENAYIIMNAKEKNLIFLTNPRDIENETISLLEFTEQSNSEFLNKISVEIANYTHEDFYLVDSINRGIIYLHGKLPDDIREYIIDKFKNEPSIKFLVANNVVLSGANFPIDTLFIKKIGNHGKNDLINLIGRVNRLSYVFNNNNNLNKLLSPIHFIDIHRNELENPFPLEKKMKLLRSLIFEDNINNDLMKLESKVPNSEKERYEKNNKKKDMVLKDYNRQADETLTKEHIEQLLYMYDLHDLYKEPQKRCQEILEQIQSTTKIVELDNAERAILDKINLVFFQKYEGQEYTTIFGNYALGRLRHTPTRQYYQGFLKLQKTSLKNRIEDELIYFNSRKDNDHLLFIGDELGEIARTSDEYPDSTRKLFIDLRKKSPKQLVNIAISKINIEDEYVSFQLHKFFGFLYDVDLLSQDAYNQLIYGSNNSTFITLVKQGLPMNIVHLLDENQILSSIEVGDYDIKGNENYINFYEKQISDFLKFTLDQYIDQE